MNKNKKITKFTGLLLLICVFCAQMSTDIYACKTTPKDKETTEEPSKVPQIKQVSLDVVVPSFDIDFGDLGFPTFTQIILAEISQKSYYHSPLIFYSNSYFENLFENRIAINAP